MTYQTHHATTIDAIGTYFQGELSGVSYDTLCWYFGDPDVGDDYKVSVEWRVRFEDGLIATVYDWKTAPSYCDQDGVDACDQTEWHIGGLTPEVVGRIQTLVRAVAQ